MISSGGPPFNLSDWGDDEPKIDTRLYVGDRPIEPTDGSLTYPGDQSGDMEPWDTDHDYVARASLYDTCGCIAPCPDHKSPAQDGRRDRDYWNDHHYPSEESE